jgi:hypothetical protein
MGGFSVWNHSIHVDIDVEMMVPFFSVGTTAGLSWMDGYF